MRPFAHIRLIVGASLQNLFADIVSIYKYIPRLVPGILHLYTLRPLKISIQWNHSFYNSQKILKVLI